MEVDEISVATSVSVEEECLSISVESECLANSSALMDGQSELSAATSSTSICVETALGSFPECFGCALTKETKRRARGKFKKKNMLPSHRNA